MNLSAIEKILRDNDHPRPSGSLQEQTCAEYLLALCRRYDLSARIEKFPVSGCETDVQSFTVDGREIPCCAYLGCGDADVCAPLYFLHGYDSVSLSLCRDRIVVADGYPVNFQYEDIVRAGASALICYEGNAFSDACGPVSRPYFYNRSGDCPIIPAAVISSRDALELFVSDAEYAELHIRQNIFETESQNVVAYFPGKTDDDIVCTAHYDTTPASHGAYDNMSGCAALLNVMDAVSSGEQLCCGLRIVFTGCEETGGFGARSFLTEHGDALGNCILNINVDMLGAVGELQCICSAEEPFVRQIRDWSLTDGIPMKVIQDVYSGDSSEFVRVGIPAITFTRFSPGFGNIAPFHNRLDTPEILSRKLLGQDIDTVTAFVRKCAEGDQPLYTGSIPDAIKEKLAVQLGMKRPEE